MLSGGPTAPVTGATGSLVVMSLPSCQFFDRTNSICAFYKATLCVLVVQRTSFEDMNCSVAQSLERVPYQYHPRRAEYRLTDNGRDLLAGRLGHVPSGATAAPPRPTGLH